MSVLTFISEADPKRRKTTTVTTQTITDANGHVTTVKMTEEVSCPTVTAATLCQSQSILSVYSFSDKNTESAKVILIYQAKIVKKDLNHTLAGIDYVPVSSNILTQEVNNLVKESNVIFLYIKEVEEDKSEP